MIFSKLENDGAFWLLLRSYHTLEKKGGGSPKMKVGPNMKWTGTTKIARLRKQLSFPHATDGFPRNGVWKTRAEIPYRWRVTTQIWVVFPTGCSNQKYYPHLGCDTLLVWNFAGKPVVASQNVDCFLRLKFCVYSSKTANPYLRLVYLFIQFDTIHRGSYMAARRYEITRRERVKCLLYKHQWNTNT